MRAEQMPAGRRDSSMAAKIRQLRRRLSPDPERPISQQRFAELLGVAWSSVARWEGGRNPDRNLAAKIMRLDRVLDALGDYVLPEGRLQFFEERHPLLSNLRPIDLLDTQYGAEAIMDLIERAATGSFA
jgi:transcriptional regulator with XRE-family HTH domain